MSTKKDQILTYSKPLLNFTSTNNGMVFNSNSIKLTLWKFIRFSIYINKVRGKEKLGSEESKI